MYQEKVCADPRARCHADANSQFEDYLSPLAKYGIRFIFVFIICIIEGGEMKKTNTANLIYDYINPHGLCM